jgi:hypothetical protein
MCFLVITANRYEQGRCGDNWRASGVVLQRWTDSPVPGDAGYSVVIQIQVPPEGGVRELIVKTCAVCIDYGESIVSGESDLNVLEVTCDSVWAAWWRNSCDLLMLFALTAGFLYKHQVMLVYVCWYEFENNDTSEPSMGHMEHYCNQRKKYPEKYCKTYLTL